MPGTILAVDNIINDRPCAAERHGCCVVLSLTASYSGSNPGASEWTVPHAVCRDCHEMLGAASALPGVPLAAHGRACGTRAAFHRPHGLRRLLRLGGKARQSFAARPGRDRRRRHPRRRLHLLLHRPDQGRPLGHADVPGAETVPRGRGGETPGSARTPKPSAPSAHGGHPVHRAPLAGRGLPRPHRHPTPARRTPRRPAGPPDQTDGG